MNYKKLLELYNNLDNNNKEEFILLLGRGLREEEEYSKEMGYSRENLVNCVYNVLNYFLWRRCMNEKIEGYEGNKLLLSWEGGMGDNGFDLVEIIDRGKKYVFMMSYDFGGSLCFVELVWGSELGNEKRIEYMKEMIWEGLDCEVWGCDDDV